MAVWMPKVLRYFWLFTWSVLTPILVLTVIISSLVERGPDKTEGTIMVTHVVFTNSS